MSRDRRAIVNLILAAALSLAIAALWYGPHFRDVIAVYHQNQQAAVDEGESPLYSFESNFFYVHALISMQMQLPLGLLFICGALYSLVQRRRESTLLYLWLISGIGVFALVANKAVRYTVPVLPAAALLSLCWLGDLKRTGPSASSSTTRSRLAVAAASLKVALVATITVWSLAGFFNAQWPKQGFGYVIDTPRWRWMVWARNYYGFDHRPMSDDWSIPEIVRTVGTRSLEPRTNQTDGAAHVAETSEARQPSPRESISPPTGAAGDQPTLGVVVNLPHLNPSSVALEARLQSPETAGPPLIRVEWLVADSSLDRIDRCDYLLVRTGLEHADWSSVAERSVETLIRTQPDRFKRAASFPIPLKESEAVVYRRQK